MKIKNSIIFKYLVTIIFVVSYIGACYSPPKATNDIWNFNFASIYNPSESGIKVNYTIFHNSDTSSILIYKLNKSNFISNYNENYQDEYIEVLIKYVLRNYETSKLCDSATLIYKVARRGDNDFTYEIPIKTKEKEKYNLVVLLSDNLRKTTRRILVEVDRTEENSAQYFLLQNVNNNKEILFTNYISDSSCQYRIINYLNNDSIINISYFKPIKSLPQSVFSNNVTPHIPKPDTIYQCKKSDTLRFTDKGFYFISFASVPDRGICIAKHNNEYPNITKPEAMIEPLCFLTSSKRYNEMLNAPNKKLIVDKFWLSLSSDVKRSRELIRIFYNRVQVANEMFGTYKQGWQTDRGMIYIIFGAPATVYKGPNTEQWIYGDNPELSTMNFTFIKNKNFLTNNEYILQRDPKYQTIWTQAVDTWLKGKAFSVN